MTSDAAPNSHAASPPRGGSAEPWRSAEQSRVQDDADAARTGDRDGWLAAMRRLQARIVG